MRIELSSKWNGVAVHTNERNLPFYFPGINVIFIPPRKLALGLWGLFVPKITWDLSHMGQLLRLVKTCSFIDINSVYTSQGLTSNLSRGAKGAHRCGRLGELR